MSDETAKKPKFLTMEELMERWKISRATVYAEIKRGRLRRSHIAGAVRFAMSEIERYERTA